MLTIITVFFLIGYLIDMAIGRTSLNTYITIVIILVFQQLVCYVAIKRNVFSPNFKYTALGGYTLAYCIAVFSSYSYFTYVLIFPVAIIYILYEDVVLIKIIAIVAFVINLIKILFQINAGFTSPDNMISYLVQASFVFLMSFGMYIITKNLKESHEEKIDDIIGVGEKLEESANMMGALNRATEILLTANEADISSALMSAMETVGRCVGADRVQIWRNEMINGEMNFVMRYEWLSELGASNKNIHVGLNYSYSSVPVWYEKFMKGEYVNSPVSKLSKREIEFLSLHKMVSLVCLPLFVNHEFIGFFKVDDCSIERKFTADEMKVLASAGLMFTSVFNKMIQSERIKTAYQVMIDTSPFICSVFDSMGNVVNVNDATVYFIGCSSKQEYIENFYKFSPEFQPDGTHSQKMILSNITKILKTGEKISYDEWIMKTMNGELKSVEITLSPVYIDGRELVIVHGRDLREHNKMMDGINLRDKFLQAVNTASAFLLDTKITHSDALFRALEAIGKAVEVDNVYIWKNYEIDGKLFCTRLYEWSEYGGANQDNQLIGDIEYKKVLTPEIFELFAQGECINNLVSELPEMFREHVRQWGAVSILIMPLMIDGEFWGHIGFDDCHNERIFTTEEVAALYSCGFMFVESVIRNEMVQSLQDTSARLELALQEATAASKAKGDFLSNMSHEMRTPMNAIIGMTSIGKRANEIIEKNRALDKIDNAAAHLLGVINDILDMAKIEANKMELSSDKYHFEKMIQKVITLTRFQLSEKQQKLTVNLDKKIPEIVIGDEQRLSQAITNVLSNAIKFTPNDGEVSLSITMQNERYLKIVITDNGIGINADEMGRLFNSFEQLENARKHGGTGLGLAITKRIIEMMDGEIKVESEAGKGTSFTFTVQIGLGGNYEHNEKAENESYDKSIGAFKGKRLLIAEDIDVNCEILMTLLEDSGIEIDCAKNGKIALDMVNAQKYDIVFMDIQMPEIDGLEATRRIRALDEHKDLPIIALSANVFKDDVEECLNAGMNGHLGKPFDIEKIYIELHKYLGA